MSFIRSLQYLESPLEKLASVFVTERAVVAYSGLELEVSERLSTLILRDIGSDHSGSYGWNFFDPDERANHAVRFGVIDELRQELKGNFYLDDFYFESSTSNIAGYMSARDNFAVFVCAHVLLPNGSLDEWDNAFSKHLKESEVGFGDEGRRYAIGLAAQLPPVRQVRMEAS